MRFVLGALAAVTLFAGVAASQPADARCFWDGFATVCVHHRHHFWGGPGFYHGYGYGGGYGYERPYWWGGY